MAKERISSRTWPVLLDLIFTIRINIKYLRGEAAIRLKNFRPIITLIKKDYSLFIERVPKLNIFRKKSGSYMTLK